MGHGFHALPDYAIRNLQEDYELPDEYFAFLADYGIGTVGSVVIYGEPEEASEILGGEESDIWIIGEDGAGGYFAYTEVDGQDRLVRFDRASYPDGMQLAGALADLVEATLDT